MTNVLKNTTKNTEMNARISRCREMETESGV